MSAKVVFLAFDALEETLVDRWAAEGLMPTFAQLGSRGTTYELSSTMEYFPDTGWIEFGTGKSAPAAGLYWRRAGDAGRRVAAIDPAYAPPEPGLNGVLLRDWGVHSAGFGRGSDPAGYVDEIVARYGDYPIPHGWSEEEQRSWGCDAVGATRES